MNGTTGANNEKRLIEDILPIGAINEVAQREKIGHIAIHPRKLHLWWARRPLAAARAAVYATLVPAGEGEAKADQAAGLFRALCRWDASEAVISRARAEVLASNGGVPPKVLDMFAGGGAIPLEAARLGCETTAVELNPVAHLIEKCMLEYPHRFPRLADDVRHWGKRWVDRAWEQLADLYPPIEAGDGQGSFDDVVQAGRRPLAYLWTRTVRCPNPALGEHEVPLVRQTWLARKRGRCIALRAVVDRIRLTVGWEVVKASSPEELGFDPAAGSKRGQATCFVCGATITYDYVRAEGSAGRMSLAPLAAVLLKANGRGRDYLPAWSYPLPDDQECLRRLEQLSVKPPEELIPVGDTRWFSTPPFGLTRYRDVFTPRQLLTLCTLASGVGEIYKEMLIAGIPEDRASAAATYLGVSFSRTVHYNCSLCPWHNTVEKADSAFGRQALPMVWDFVETNPFANAVGDFRTAYSNHAEILEGLVRIPSSTVIRSSATRIPLADASQDAIITDPPYYDNISYAELSDFFYVWLKRSIGFLYPDDFGGELTPKRNEAVVAPHRHHGNKEQARVFYEDMMAKSLAEANRVLKTGAPLVCIYAHKTTLGWASLVDALRTAGFTITEAWPLDTEMTTALKANVAALASSIFLVARKRKATAGVGSEGDVLAELDQVIAERLPRLTEVGVTGSDLIIATVGAGLRPFTHYERVEQDNGEQLPSERFLSIVQNRVLDAVFGGLGGADPVTRFYVAAQFSYGYAAVPFAEANNLGYMTGVEVDGPRGLTAGPEPLLNKVKSTVQLRDFQARGAYKELGLPTETSARASTIDVVHGLLWRAEHHPADLRSYLTQAQPDTALLRTVVQALAGKALRSGSGDGKAPESAAAERLLASWRHLVDDNLFSV
jgi:putative DNA methylase